MFHTRVKIPKCLAQLRNSTFSKCLVRANGLDYCANIVKQHDYENFLATLLMTKALRSPALVVRAFNVEIARAQDQTTDPQTAGFRLQFWKDTIRDIYDPNRTIQDAPANPVAQELFKVCHCYSLQKRQLEKLITSRNILLKLRHFKTFEEIEKYAEDTVSTVYYLLLKVAGVADIHADHAASHLGKAQGITNMLRSVHVSNHHKMVLFPMDVLMKHRVSQQSVLCGVHDKNMKEVIYDIACQAHSHLEKARKIKVPKLANQIFLPATSVSAYLKKLQKNDFNVFDGSLQVRSATLPFSLYMKRLVNTY